MRPRLPAGIVLPVCAALLAGCAVLADKPDLTALKEQVANTERAFARTMADRDLGAFTSFLSEDAVFFSGSGPLRGRQQVSDRWKALFEKPQPPFSWAPETVEVLNSGTLALSSGPVYGSDGKLTGTFTSIWRLEAPGTWRIVFDKGNDVCDCVKR